MPRMLITGGAGFIGTNFLRYWRKKFPHDSITVLDALTYAGNKANLADIPDIELVKGDIRDYELVQSLIADRAIDVLVHFAAESHVDRSIHGPDAFISTNIDGTHTLLKAAKKFWLDQGTGKPHRFHHISTDEVYGSLEPEEPAFSEKTQYQPNSPYAASKAASDHLVRAYHKTYGLQVTTSNCSNNYGPYHFPEKLIPLFLTNILLGKPLPIYGDGLNVREWLYVDDHCRAIDAILTSGTPGTSYNVGGGAELSNIEIIDRLCSIIDTMFATSPDLAHRFPGAPAAKGLASNSLKTYVADRIGHDRRYAIDGRKIEQELGYSPRHGIEQGLQNTVAWYIDNESWWRGILDGSYRL